MQPPINNIYFDDFTIFDSKLEQIQTSFPQTVLPSSINLDAFFKSRVRGAKTNNFKNNNKVFTKGKINYTIKCRNESKKTSDIIKYTNLTKEIYYSSHLKDLVNVNKFIEASRIALIELLNINATKLSINATHDDSLLIISLVNNKNVFVEIFFEENDYIDYSLNIPSNEINDRSFFGSSNYILNKLKNLFILDNQNNNEIENQAFFFPPNISFYTSSKETI